MSEQRQNGEYHRADPVYRRQMQVVLGLTTVVGIAALAALHLWLRKLGTTTGTGDILTYATWLNRLLGGLCLVLGVTAAGFALWMHRIAMASKAERRWPPSSMRTSADVRIRYLTSADSFVGELRAGAFAIGLIALVLVAGAAWLFWTG